MKVLTLYNKRTPVLQATYDTDNHLFGSINALMNTDFCPPDAIAFGGDITVASLNEWWHGRAIPVSRDNYRSLRFGWLQQIRPIDLVEQSQGFSLSDQYWLAGLGPDLDWDTGNFFDNDFDGMLGLVSDSHSLPTFNRINRSPSSALGGHMLKAWVIDDDGTRTLIKRSADMVQQAPYNEVIATDLYRRVLSDDQYVPYELRTTEEGTVFCACPDLVTKETELVSAWALLASKEADLDCDMARKLKRRTEEIGLPHAMDMLSRMFVCDVLMANYDRHLDNFGFIRDVHTLQYLGVAPIYDTGDALWLNKQRLREPSDFEWEHLPRLVSRREKQTPQDVLGLVEDLDWLDRDAVSCWQDATMELLATNENLTPQRLEAIQKGIGMNIQAVFARADELARQKKSLGV